MMVGVKKLKAFVFDWKMSWKYFEKYLKKGMREFPGVSQRRQQVMAFIKRTLNDNKIRVITKDKMADVENVLKEASRENQFFQKSSEIFIRFLQDILS